MTGLDQPILVAPKLDALDLATMVTRLVAMRDALAACPDVPEHKSRPADELRRFDLPNGETYLYYQSFQRTGSGSIDRSLTMHDHPTLKPFTISEDSRQDIDPAQRNERSDILAWLDGIIAQAKLLARRKRNSQAATGLTGEADQICQHVATFLTSRARGRGLVPNTFAIQAGRPYRPFSAIMGAVPTGGGRLERIKLSKPESETIAAMLPPISAISIRVQNDALTYQLGPFEHVITVNGAPLPSVVDEMKAYRALGVDGLALAAKA